MWQDGQQFWDGLANGSTVNGLYERGSRESPTTRAPGLRIDGERRKSNDDECDALHGYICEAY